jgi:hypothetical protein
MLKRDGPYIFATLHDFKNNISSLMAMIHAPDSDIDGIILKNRNKKVAVVVPYRESKKGGPSGPVSIDWYDK